MRLASLFGLIVWAATAAALSAPPTAWQLAPYRVQALAALEATPELQALAPTLCRGLVARCDALVGGPWTVSVALAEAALREAILTEPERITVDLVPKAALDGDKVVLLGAAPVADGYAVWARELDLRTGQFGPLVRLPATGPSRLLDALLQAMLDAFRPLAQIERVEKDRAQLAVRAGGLPTRDRSLALLGADLAFEAWLPQGDAAALAPLAGALLRADKVQSELTPAELESVEPASFPATCGGAAAPLALGITARQRAMQAPAVEADESLRRQAEAAALALDDDLTDLVALREIVLTQAKAQLAAGRTAEAKASLAELKAMPTREQFLARVAAEQKKWAGGGLATQRRHQAMFNRLSQWVEKTLGDEPVRQFIAQLEPPPEKKPSDGKKRAK